MMTFMDTTTATDPKQTAANRFVSVNGKTYAVESQTDICVVLTGAKGAWASLVKNVNSHRWHLVTERSAKPVTTLTWSKFDHAKLAKELGEAEKKVQRTSERRRALPAGSPRSRVTTANARWATACEHRDRLLAQLREVAS